MGRRILGHLRSHVIAYLALFFALTGTAVALPGTNTVFSDDIANGQVKSADIANGKVSTADIGDSQVKNADIGVDAVRRSEIAANAVGPAELGTVVQRTNSISVPAGSARVVSKDCDPGELALSVGANWDGAQTVGPVLQAATFLTGGNDPTGGEAAGRNEGAGARTLTVIVSCLG
jgi:hypothetical protein